MKDQAQPKPSSHRDAPPASRPPRQARTSASGRPGGARAKQAASGRPAPEKLGRGRRDPLAYQPLRVVNGGMNPARPPRPAHAGHGAAHRRNRRRIPPEVLWNARFLALRNLSLVVLALEVVWLALTSPLLVVHHVAVSGAHIRSPKQIVQVAGLTRPVNIFRAPAGRARAKLAALPEVESVRVERRFPSTLAVVVTERRPLASVLTKEGCWVMDRAGLVFRRVAKPLANHPVLVVQPKARIALGKPLPLPALPAALGCLALLPDLPLARNVRFHVDASQEAWLNNSDGFKIRLGPLDNAPDRLAVTGRVLNGPDGAEIMRTSIALDMTTPNSEVRRPRPDTGRISGSS